jgi:hypothetical protein
MSDIKLSLVIWHTDMYYVMDQIYQKIRKFCVLTH